MEGNENRNTLLTYLYRDASNYKFYDQVFLAGHISFDDIAPFFHETDYFLPELVGLKSLVPEQLSVDDHPWHEVVSCEPTNKMNVSMSAGDFKNSMLAQKCKKWVVVRDGQGYFYD